MYQLYNIYIKPYIPMTFPCNIIPILFLLISPTISRLPPPMNSSTLNSQLVSWKSNLLWQDRTVNFYPQDRILIVKSQFLLVRLLVRVPTVCAEDQFFLFFLIQSYLRKS